MNLATRLGLVLAFPFLLGASALADDTPKPAPKPDDAKPAMGDAKEDPKEAGEKIAWVHDYDEAKKQAAAEKKGLFVYLTPTWFT